MPKPFRFGVQVGMLPAESWRERVRRIEALGYSTLFFPDHFSTQWEPVAGLAAVAAATERLNVGSLVYDVDYRHPVVLAKAAATIQLLSGGRHEFGIGAGWMQTDYVEAGIAYDRPGVRIERLEEALQIIRSMWANERTGFPIIELASTSRLKRFSVLGFRSGCHSSAFLRYAFLISSSVASSDTSKMSYQSLSMLIL